MFDVAFVSCDIVGHSDTRDAEVQLRRVADINCIVAQTLSSDKDQIFWASGGDGGHVLFCNPDWQNRSLLLLRELREWSAASQVPLRLTAHFGSVSRIEGADGRPQFIGDGINFSGRLLKVASPQAILVSQAFRRASAEAKTTVQHVFTSSRQLYLKSFGLQRLSVLSFQSSSPAIWDTPNDDSEGLEFAVEDQRAWDAVYFAKRIMQRNMFDEGAEFLLERVESHLFVSTPADDDPGTARLLANPFFMSLDADSRTEVIRTAQLIEIECGECLCRAGDHGDSMFVVLRGQVGVYREQAASQEIPESDTATAMRVASINPGEIVGELALALRRPRTATLIAMQDTALLSLNMVALESVLKTHPEAEAGLDKFITSRTLEFVAHQSTLLLGQKGNGPLSGLSAGKPWDRIARFAKRIIWPASTPRPLSLADAALEQDGLYFLVAGCLRSTAFPDKILRGEDLPLLYADLPGRIALPDHAYRAEESDATVLRIATDAFVGRNSIVDSVISVLLTELAHRGFFHFDVFLSYTFDDLQTAIRWRKALENAGLRVYMEESRSGHYFRERIQTAILDSLTLVALVASNTMSRPLEHNWVRHEIAYRCAAFELKTARIFPVRLQGGKPELLADGYTVIDASRGEDDAIEELVSGIRAVKDGVTEPPFSLTRKSDLPFTETVT